MKKQTVFLLGILSLFLFSCSTYMTGDTGKLYGNAWELEYITGPRITFEGLFPDEKPVITFKKDGQTVSGTTGCNSYNTKYTMVGNKMTIANPELMTMRYCGDGEAVFLNTMKDVTGYRITADGKLELLMKDIPVMRFKNSSK